MERCWPALRYNNSSTIVGRSHAILVGSARAYNTIEPNLPSILPLQRHAVFTVSPHRYVRGSSLLFKYECLIFCFKAISLTLFLFVIHFTSVDAVNLNACGTRLQAQRNDAVQNATNATESPSVLHVSYEQCLAECGTGMGDVNWQAFSQNFGAWFLPWISLMFQIPFGAERKCKCYAFASCEPLYAEQGHWTTLFPSSSPWVLRLSRPTPSKSHTSTNIGLPQPSWTSSIQIPNLYQRS